MIVIRTDNNALQVGNQTFIDAVVTRAKAFVGIVETKSGEHRLEHPFIAFFDILKRLRGAENKAERDAIESALRAKGVTDEKEIESARKSVKSTMDNGRVTLAMLRRLHGETVGTGLPITLDSEQVRDAKKALRKSVGGWEGHIDDDTFIQVMNGLSVVFSNARNSTISALDLGFTPDAMETFLKGETLQLAEAIETSATENESE